MIDRAIFAYATEPYLSRFLADVQESEGHWLWTGRLTPGGYGRFDIFSQTVTAHHLAYEWAYGPLHSWLEADHVCRVILCVRPAHLDAVTHVENIRRGKSGEALRANPHPLAKYLCERGVSIREFAEEMFTGTSTISLLLRGRRSQNPEVVYRVGAVLGLSWEETDQVFPRAGQWHPPLAEAATSRRSA